VALLAGLVASESFGFHVFIRKINVGVAIMLLRPRVERRKRRTCAAAEPWLQGRCRKRFGCNCLEPFHRQGRGCYRQHMSAIHQSQRSVIQLSLERLAMMPPIQNSVFAAVEHVDRQAKSCILVFHCREFVLDRNHVR